MIIKRWTGSGTVTLSFNLTNGSAVATGTVANVQQVLQGATVTGTGIPANTVVNSVSSVMTSFTMSAAYTGTTGSVSLTFTGGFAKHFPQTKAQSIRNNSDSDNVFDSNDRIKINYLPDAVFDSLYFQSALIGNTTAASLAQQAKASATTNKRTPTGMYFVSSNATITITGSTEPGAGSATLINGAYYSGAIYASDEGSVAEAADAYIPSTILETGDWIVLQTFQGSGTQIDPYVATFVVVENTYELFVGSNGTTAGTPGLVPAPAGNQNLHFLRGDGTWVIPTNTTYTGSASVILNSGSFERAALTGDVTASQNNNATTIANDAVTFAKMQNIATSTILGRNDAGTGDIEALTAAEVRTLLNVADGATANTGTVTSVGLSLPGMFTVSGTPVTTSGTLTAALASQTAKHVLIAPNAADGVPTFRALVASDIPTLNQNTTGTAANVTGTVAVANGGTGQTSYTDGQLLIGNSTGNTLTKATLTAGTSITISNGSGAITINNSAPNATHTGDVTGSGALTIASKAVTYAKIQDISATNRILGRITAGAGVTEELTAANVRSIIELAAPIYIQTATPTPTVNNSLWYDINP